VRPLGMTAAALGLVAAVLNGVFGLCLGCEMYLIIRRTWPRTASPQGQAEHEAAGTEAAQANRQ
jgi:hypothetical protein